MSQQTYVCMHCKVVVKRWRVLGARGVVNLSGVDRREIAVVMGNETDWSNVYAQGY